MLYTKENGKLTPIYEDNLYTKCPICGKEIVANEMWDFEENEADFYSFMTNQIQVYCADCTEHLKEEEPKEIKTDHDRIVKLTHIIRDSKNKYNKTISNKEVQNND